MDNFETVRVSSPRISERPIRLPGPNVRLIVSPTAGPPPIRRSGLSPPIAPPVINIQQNISRTKSSLKIPIRPNYSAMNQQQISDMRAKFDMNFDSLRRQYIPDLPVIPSNISLDAVHDIYESYIRQLVVDIKCKEWKLYAAIAIYAAEKGSCEYLIDIDGFTKNYALIFSLLDPILAELAENSITSQTESSPTMKILWSMGLTLGIYSALKYAKNHFKASFVNDDILSQIMSGIVKGVNPTPLARDDSGIPNPPPQNSNGPLGGLGLGGGLGGILSSLGNMGGLSSILNAFNGGLGGGGGEPARRTNIHS